jgi:hypothetical protein
MPLCRVKWNVILSTSEQTRTLVQATASIIMGVHYIFKYANQLLLYRVTPGVVRLATQMENMIRMHNYEYEEVQVENMKPSRTQYMRKMSLNFFDFL